MVICRYSCFSHEQPAATHKLFAFPMHPDVKVLVRLVSPQGNVHTLNHAVALRCCEQQGADIDLRQRPFFARPRCIRPQKDHRWLCHFHRPRRKRVSHAVTDEMAKERTETVMETESTIVGVTSVSSSNPTFCTLCAVLAARNRDGLFGRDGLLSRTT